MKSINLIRDVMVHPGVEVRRPTPRMGQSLRFRKVCLFPSQRLRQQFLLRDVHRSADEPLEDSQLDHGCRHRAKVAQLPPRSNDSYDLVEAEMILSHDF